jgi:hypothetical protein
LAEINASFNSKLLFTKTKTHTHTLFSSFSLYKTTKKKRKKSLYKTITQISLERERKREFF